MESAPVKTSATSQTAPTIFDGLDTLVFSGGGVRGLAFAGFLMAVADHAGQGAHAIFKNFVGTSVGALMALICAIGLDVQRGLQLFETVGLERIFAKDPTWLLQTYALNDATALQELLVAVLQAAGLDADVTFGDLHKKTKKHLTVTAVDALTGEMLYLCHSNEGRDMPVRVAIMGSMALPPLFPAVSYSGPLHGRPNGTQLLLLDGGLLDNFPIGHCNPETTMGVRANWYMAPGQPTSDIATYYTRILNILSLTMHSIQCKIADTYKYNVYIDLGPLQADDTRVPTSDIIFRGYRTASARFGALTRQAPNSTSGSPNSTPGASVEAPTKFLADRVLNGPAYIKGLLARPSA